MEAKSRMTDDNVSIGNLVLVNYLSYSLLGIVTLKERVTYSGEYCYDIFIFNFPWKIAANRTIGRSIKDIREVLA